MEIQIFPKALNKWIVRLVIAATAVTGGIVVYGVSQFRNSSENTATQVEISPPVRKVAALGRLEPEAEVIRLFAPLALDGDRVFQLLVKQGDRVEKGQAIAILDSRERLQNALQQAQTQVQVAEAKLAQVKAGAKAGEIAAQRATIARLKAQWEGDRKTQTDAIARIEAQWEGEKTQQESAIARILAQWQGDRIAQAATIRKLEAELKNAIAEDRRYEQVYREGAYSRSVFESKRLALETTQQELAEARAVLSRINTTSSKQLQEAQAILERINTTSSKQLNEAKAARDRINATGNQQVKEAEATLNSIAEVRPTDVQAAQAEVENAIAAFRRAQTDLAQAYIKAPITGQILKIHTRIGEKIHENGIAEMAETNHMVAVAEVYQTDIGQVKIGQNAKITGQAFEGELRGIVSEIGWQVNRQNVFSNQPGENLDRRVVEVKIRLHPEDSQRVSGLTNLQVETTIELSNFSP